MEDDPEKITMIKSLLEKHGDSSAKLKEKEHKLRHQLEAIECSMPALLLTSMKKAEVAGVTTHDFLNQLNKLFSGDAGLDSCICGPCPSDEEIGTDKSAAEKSASTTHLDYIKHLYDMAVKEKELKRTVQEMEHKEKVYMETLRVADELWANMESKYKSTLNNVKNDGLEICEQLELINERLQAENQQLADEVKDVKLELKHCKEVSEGPLLRQLEREKKHVQEVEIKLSQVSEASAVRECQLSQQISTWQTKYNTVAEKLRDLNDKNRQTRQEKCFLECKYNELQQELIQQKISEAHTLQRMNEAMCKQTAKANQTNFNGTGLGTISRNLGNAIQHVENCNTCVEVPANLVNTAKGIKNLVDMVDGQSTRDSRHSAACTPAKKQIGCTKSCPTKTSCADSGRDINVTTTVTDSGCLEVTTQGPAGTIETKVNYTESGNIEVTTDLTDYCPESRQGERCRRAMTTGSGSGAMDASGGDRMDPPAEGDSIGNNNNDNDDCFSAMEDGNGSLENFDCEVNDFLCQRQNRAKSILTMHAPDARAPIVEQGMCEKISEPNVIYTDFEPSVTVDNEKNVKSKNRTQDYKRSLTDDWKKLMQSVHPTKKKHLLNLMNFLTETKVQPRNQDYLVYMVLGDKSCQCNTCKCGGSHKNDIAACDCAVCDCAGCPDPHISSRAGGGGRGQMGAGGEAKKHGPGCRCSKCRCKPCKQGGAPGAVSPPQGGSRPQGGVAFEGAKNCTCAGPCTCAQCPDPKFAKRSQGVSATAPPTSTSFGTNVGGSDTCDCPGECPCTDCPLSAREPPPGCPCTSTVSNSMPKSTIQRHFANRSPADVCDCRECICNDCPDPNKAKSKLATAIGAVPAGCDCPVCNCDPCTPNTNAHPPGCDCPACTCDPCNPGSGGASADATGGAEVRGDVDMASGNVDPASGTVDLASGNDPASGTVDLASGNDPDSRNAELASGQAQAAAEGGGASAKHPPTCNCSACVCKPCKFKKHGPGCRCKNCVCQPCKGAAGQGGPPPGKAAAGAAPGGTEIGGASGGADDGEAAGLPPPEAGVVDASGQPASMSGVGANADHPPGCDCPECICDPCNPKTGSAHPPGCDCPECTCDPCNPDGGNEPAKEHLSDPCNPNAESPHPPGCDCPECTCDPCNPDGGNEPAKEHLSDPCNPNAESPHPPGCDCPECTCDPCNPDGGNEPAKEHPPGCTCPKCVCDPCEPEGKTAHPPGCDCPDCLCNPCTPNKSANEAKTKSALTQTGPPQERPHPPASGACQCGANDNHLRSLIEKVPPSKLHCQCISCMCKNCMVKDVIKEQVQSCDCSPCLCDNCPDPTVQKAAPLTTNSFTPCKCRQQQQRGKLQASGEAYKAKTGCICSTCICSPCAFGGKNEQKCDCSACECLNCPDATVVKAVKVCNCDTAENEDAESGLKITGTKRVTEDALLVKWSNPSTKNVIGYEILVNGSLKSRVPSARRTLTLLHPVDFEVEVDLSLYAVTVNGRCEPPARAMFNQ